MKAIKKFLFSRVFIIGVLILVQAAFLLLTILALSRQYFYVYIFNLLLSITIVFWIVNKNDNPSFKIPWIIFISAFPVFGGLFYAFFGSSKINVKVKKRAKEIYGFSKKFYPENKDILDEIKRVDKQVYTQCSYIFSRTGMPVYKNTSCEYFELGEYKFEAMKRELRKAKKFIFLEYFIIEPGEMWDEILEILKEKARENVDVRLIYDDVGCIQTLPSKYNKLMESYGIKCEVFNPLRPALKTVLHNRDHRKILVIDGNVGFTGGVNLADEYINAYAKHGHWKDAAVMLKGEGVKSLTLMFLEMWNFYRKTDSDFSVFLTTQAIKTDGYVQPYHDSPLDSELLGENIYLNIINNATDYLYINTPYLIIDNELLTALTLAAKKGVDVKIVTPHIADKEYVHHVSRSFYKQLVKDGVEIYEYTPGFIHSKTFVSDDKLATVGTINLDYRSLYHHFECGTLIYGSSVIAKMKEDFEETLKVCTLINLKDCESIGFFTRIKRALLRIIAPLM